MSELLSPKKKKRGRPRKHTSKGKMLKVSQESLEKITSIKELEEKSSNAEVIDFLLSTYNFVKNAEKAFIVDNTLIKNANLSKARGIAIENAVREHRPPTKPQILLHLGEDSEL